MTTGHMIGGLHGPAATQEGRFNRCRSGKGKEAARAWRAGLKAEHENCRMPKLRAYLARGFMVVRRQFRTRHGLSRYCCEQSPQHMQHRNSGGAQGDRSHRYAQMGEVSGAEQRLLRKATGRDRLSSSWIRQRADLRRPCLGAVWPQHFAIAAGSRRAETSETSARAVGCQSGAESASPTLSSDTPGAEQ